MPIADADVMGLWIAALGGAAVGIERQWSGHAEGLRARFAGIRTFSLIGGLGGLSGALWSLGVTGPAVVVLSGTAALCVAAYFAASRSDVDGTTEVAALVVLTSGVLAGLGSYRLASGIIAVTCLLLVEKSRLHSLVARIDDVALRAGVRFGVMALVVLPLLPEGPYGPFGGIRPRELWALALFFSGLSFLGYVARRMLGPDQGYFVAGLLGGLVSSTNVTFTFARTSRAESASDGALAYGAIAANAMLYPRVLVAVAVLNLPMLPLVARYLALPALAAVTAAVVGSAALPRRDFHGFEHREPAAIDVCSSDGVCLPGDVDARASCRNCVGIGRRVRFCCRAGTDRCRCAHRFDGQRCRAGGLAPNGSSRNRDRRPREHRSEACARVAPWESQISENRWTDAGSHGPACDRESRTLKVV